MPKNRRSATRPTRRSSRPATRAAAAPTVSSATRRQRPSSSISSSTEASQIATNWPDGGLDALLHLVRDQVREEFEARHRQAAEISNASPAQLQLPLSSGRAMLGLRCSHICGRVELCLCVSRSISCHSVVTVSAGLVSTVSAANVWCYPCMVLLMCGVVVMLCVWQPLKVEFGLRHGRTWHYFFFP